MGGTNVGDIFNSGGKNVGTFSTLWLEKLEEHFPLCGGTNVGDIFTSGGNNVGHNFNSVVGIMWGSFNYVAGPMRGTFSTLWLDKCGGILKFVAGQRWGTFSTL